MKATSTTFTSSPSIESQRKPAPSARFSTARMRRPGDLLLLLAGLALTGYAVWTVRQDAIVAADPAWPWWLMLAGALVGGYALRRMEQWLPEAAPRAQEVEFPGVGRRVLGLLCVLAAMVLTAWVIVRLWPNYHLWHGTVLPWTLALLLTLLGGWLIRAIGKPSRDYGPTVVRRRQTHRPPEGPIALPRRLELTAFVLILAVAVFVRLYRLNEIPAAMYVDETNASLDALYILEGRGDSPFGTGWYETPNSYIYYMAGLYRLFGANYWTLKAASLIPALLTIPAVYLLGRTLFGPLTGLVSMFLMAVSRWHMTMSRWGWNELMPPLFQVLGVYLLLRGLRRRRAFDYALGGLITGLTLYTYLASRLAIGTIGLFVLYWVLSDYEGAWTSWKRHWRGLVLFGVAAVIAMAPIGVTYMTNPFTFFNRAAEINIFHEVQSAGSLHPLWENIWRHVKLFYQQGDPTGRQNLPGEPQTDPVTGTFLAVGLAYGLLRLRDRRRGLLWMWLTIAMAGGYLSELHIDSPNSYRTLTAVPAIAFLAGDALVTLARGVYYSLSPATAPAPGRRIRWAAFAPAALVMTALLSFSAYWEIDTFFGRQAESPAVQNSFNQMETQVGYEVVRALNDGAAVYLSHRFYNFSPLRFLVYGAVRGKVDRNPLDDPPFHLARPEVDLPIPDAGGGALLLLDNYYQGVMDYFRHFYPDLEAETVTGPGDAPLFLRLWIPEADLAALQGLRLTITRGDGGLEERRVTRAGAVEGIEGAQRLEWRGSIRLEKSGVYDFVVENGALSVDGLPWPGPHYLGRGLHALAIVQENPTRERPPSVRWQTPLSQPEPYAPLPPSVLFVVDPPRQGLLGVYYDNEQWAGPPVMQQVTPFLLLAWPPDEPVYHPFSATFSGRLRIETPGPYRFRIEADDGVRFRVDGQVVGESLVPDRPNRVEAVLDLAPGDHPIQIDYFQRGGGSALEFYWQPPGAPESPVPPSVLIPAEP